MPINAKAKKICVGLLTLKPPKSIKFLLPSPTDSVFDGSCNSFCGQILLILLDITKKAIQYILDGFFDNFSLKEYHFFAGVDFLISAYSLFKPSTISLVLSALGSAKRIPPPAVV